LIVIIGLPLAMAIIWGPIWQVKKTKVDPSEIWKAENEFRKTLIQIIGGILLICGLFFSIEQLNQFYISQKNMKADQISSRYSKAIELLAKEEPTTRIGAIYALEQIVVESPNYLETVLKVLSAFVRTSEYALTLDGDEIVSQDALSAVTVIGRIRSKESSRETFINLTHSKLKMADLASSNLSYVELSKAILIEANLKGTDLQKAKLAGTDLYRANLNQANLKKVILTSANLSYADLSESELCDADLKGADLENVNLDGADLQRADLDGANLRNASLWFTDLRSVKGLKLEQILQVKTLFQARGLPTELRGLINQMKPELLTQRPAEK
jgi:uncharacterized protein YjbI with pentapeptide repeats